MFPFESKLPVVISKIPTALGEEGMPPETVTLLNSPQNICNSYTVDAKDLMQI